MKSETSTTSLLLDQLSRNSTPYQDPLSRVNWQALNTHSYWLPETALSLYGVPEFMELPEEQRMRLSQYEFLHLLEVGLWLEGLFMEQLCRALRAHQDTFSMAAYHLHEIREEAGHSLLFMELIQRSGLGRLKTNFQGLRWLDRVGRHAAPDSLLFWAATLVGEEIPDRINRLILKHAESLCPAVVDIVRLHTIDESRHITHAKNMVSAIMQSSGRASKLLSRYLLPRLFRQFVQVLYFPAPDVYDRSGLMPGRSWAGLARRNRLRHRFITAELESSLRLLKQQGFALQWRHS